MCGERFKIAPDVMLCPKCSAEQNPDEPLKGVLEVVVDGDLPDDWDVLDLLPVEREFFPEIPVGNTPLWKPVNLRSELGLKNLFIKDDTLEPTGSFKDRASYLVAAFARKYGINNIVVASTGNAASSMAGVGAAAGISVTVFVPKSAPKAKLTQILQYGAKLIAVDGNYDLAFDLSLEYSRENGAMSRNTAYNPLTIEGKKTVSLEIFKKLGAAPDYVFVPVGDGVIIAGVYRGFIDLKKFELIEKIPTIYAVQSSGSDAICRAVSSGKFVRIPTSTVADSICVDVPRNGYYAKMLLEEYGGRCVVVSDDKILAAQKLLASTTGLFAEPAGAASLAGLIEVKDEIPQDATIVVLATGNGLKDIDAAASFVGTQR